MNKIINFNLFKNISVTFEISKQNFCWNNLNRENSKKFSQKAEQKTIKTSSEKTKNSRENCFSVASGGPRPASALCGGFYLPLAGLAQPFAARGLLAPAPLAAGRRIESDGPARLSPGQRPRRPRPGNPSRILS
jgi:hypothetical protein